MKCTPGVMLGLVLILSSAAHAAGVDGPDLEAQIEAREYEVSFQRQLGSYQAPNRAHGFRTLFVAPGIRLVPREETEAPWEWGLTWIGYGRGNLSWPVPETTPAPVRSRMDYARGALSEWYENSPRGLKQGFLLSASPEELLAGSGARASSAEPLHMDLALTGTLSPVVAADGQSIDFVAGGTRILRYAELRVTDGRGREIRSWMEASVRGDVRVVRLVLDAADAVFPLTVDPLATSPVWGIASDQASASLGASVATAGDVDGDGLSDIVVGVPLYDGGQTNEGRVLFFRGTPSGPQGGWAYESDLPGGANLGASVGTAGDVNGDGYADVIVGAPGFDNPESNEGRAYLFLGSAAGLSPTPAWTVESNLNFATYGSSVGTAGDVNGDGYSDVVVGAASAARAYLYLGSPSGLSTVPTWQESSFSPSRYGAAVGTAGDVNGDGYADFIVGAPNWENGHTAEGAVFLYYGSATGPSGTPWGKQSDHPGALFGSSVGTAGDVNGDGYADVIIGAPLYDNGQADEGLAFVFLGSTTGLAFDANWSGESGQIAGHYGSSVGTAGDVNGDSYADFLVGGEQITNGHTSEGRAWLYYGGPTLPQAPAWTTESNQTGGGIKLAVATAGDVNGDGYADVLVGYPNFDNPETDEGIALLFLGSAGTPSTSPSWMRVPASAALYLAQVEPAGDVNGDGYSDFLLGIHHWTPGRAELYLGSQSGPSATPAWIAVGDPEWFSFAWSLGAAGDVNGDGYGDVVVGTYSEGAIRVYLGSVTGLSTTPAWIIGGLGFVPDAGTAGDVNGDGYGDLLVGAPNYGPDDRGRAMVYLGSAAGLSLTPAWIVEGSVSVNDLGYHVATAGDVNRDGFSDVLVEALGGPFGSSRAFLYLGSTSGLSTTPAWTPDVFGVYFTSIEAAGDVNGDGYGDVVGGNAWYPSGTLSPGRAYLYLGSPSGLSPTPAWIVDGVESSGQRGQRVATAGDVNGDGYADVLIGAPRESNGQINEGRALLYLGSFSGPAPPFSPDWSVESDESYSRFGDYLATAGDVNGDGYADVLVAAPLSDQTSLDGGRVYLYNGNGGLGEPMIPAQGRGGDGVPIPRWGASDGPAFYLNAMARTPFGRGKVRFETEVERLDRTFDGLLTTLGSPTDAGTGLMLESLEANLASGTPYHWRVRLRYDPVTTPFAARSRWFTVPWGGWNEAMLRTPAAPLGRVGGGGGGGLVLQKGGSTITASWVDDGSCLETDQAYALYEGTLGNFTSHVPVACYVPGSSLDFTPQAGNRYFLLAPVNWIAEGSHGLDGDGNERPRGAVNCQAQQQIGACP